MIRSIIIDDEQHCVRALLKDLQHNCPSVESSEKVRMPSRSFKKNAQRDFREIKLDLEGE